MSAVAEREVVIGVAAQHLLDAARSGIPTPPVRDVLPDLDAAYATQERLVCALVAAGDARSGRKVGLTADAVRAQLGVDQPDFGVLLASMDVSGLPSVPRGRLIAPRIEAEVAFVLAADIDDPAPEMVRAAVDHAVAALEIVDSRIADWDITLADTVADNASCGLYVLGAERVDPRDLDLPAVRMSLSRNGEVESTGTGADCLGDPWEALFWVARTAHQLGRPLRAGEVVLSGALGPMVPFHPGDRIEAEISGLGAVAATAAKG